MSMKRPSKRDRPTKRVCKCGVKLPHSYGRNGDKVTGLCRRCLAPINASTVSISSTKGVEE